MKFYLDARPNERANRRYAELASKGSPSALATVEEEMKKRDTDDSTRAIAPLIIPDGAIIVDTTGKDIEGVLKMILTHIEDRESQKQ